MSKLKKHDEQNKSNIILSGKYINYASLQLTNSEPKWIL